MFEPQTLEMLEFTAIRARLCDYAMTASAKARAMSLAPCETPEEVARATQLSASARKVFDAMGAPPLSSLSGLDALSDKLRLGEVLSIGELNALASFLNHCRLLKRYMERAATIHALIASYGGSIDPLPGVQQEIERCVRGERIEDHASALLRSLRSQCDILANRIKDKLTSLLRSHPDWFQESFYSRRGARYVLPVKREMRGMLRGTVLDASASGATVFIEPESVSALQRELDLTIIEEENEVMRILAELSALVATHTRELSINREAMEQIDYAFACGKLGSALSGECALPTARRELVLVDARHPLLGPGTVPLTLTLGHVKGLIITGPNTGGKTVALKTVGLLSLMAMSGLLVPAREARIPMFSGIYCDIGDGQSIAQNLSTFSSHVSRIIRILDHLDGKSLVLLDELGSGTDPQEGMGLAVAVLEEIGRRGCLLVATSHYPEIKRFAASYPGYQNARMTFDRATLSPLYRLEMGEAGESCALYIAERLGMNRRLLERAWSAAYPGAGGARVPASEPGDAVAGAQSKPVPPAAAPSATASSATASPAHVSFAPASSASASSAPASSAPALSASASSARVSSAPASSVPASSAPASSERAQAMPPIPEDMPVAAPEAPRPVFVGEQYKLGDVVFVTSMNRHGVVCQERNARGELGVRIQGKNFSVPEKRLKPFISGEALYPGEGYDLDIVLDTWENRQAKRDVRKGKPGASVTLKQGKPTN